jgi:hypothetical protein
MISVSVLDLSFRVSEFHIAILNTSCWIIWQSFHKLKTVVEDVVWTTSIVVKFNCDIFFIW